MTETEARKELEKIKIDQNSIDTLLFLADLSEKNANMMRFNNEPKVSDVWDFYIPEDIARQIGGTRWHL